jgi:O-succinylbenzoate synthase
MLTASYTTLSLQFIHPSGTSRGVLTQKPAWFISLQGNHGERGIGEVSFIDGLSVESLEQLKAGIEEVCSRINAGEQDPHTPLPSLPGIQFALECAALDLAGGGGRSLFSSDFTEGVKGIRINGLIWMGEPGSMKQQIREKMSSGYRVLKLKVGALEIEQELQLLRWIRSAYGERDLEIRVDANGAWTPEQALRNMGRFAAFGIHSVEQPIAPGQWEAMARICREAPFPVALDEELIGVDVNREGAALMQAVRPHYLILKPGLLGGFRTSERWIGLAGEAGAGWWITSALESSIGLSAIAQWTGKLGVSIPQGLGTGALYRNNLPSPLEMVRDRLWYRKEKGWDLSLLGPL